MSSLDTFLAFIFVKMNFNNCHLPKICGFLAIALRPCEMKEIIRLLVPKQKRKNHPLSGTGPEGVDSSLSRKHWETKKSCAARGKLVCCAHSVPVCQSCFDNILQDIAEASRYNDLASYSSKLDIMLFIPFCQYTLIFFCHDKVLIKRVSVNIKFQCRKSHFLHAK